MQLKKIDEWHECVTKKKTNFKKIATPTHHATTQKNATFWSVTFIYKMVWESLRCLGRWDRNISRTSSQCFGSFASLHHTHQPFYTFLDSSSAPQKHLKVPSLLQSFTIEAYNIPVIITYPSYPETGSNMYTLSSSFFRSKYRSSSSAETAFERS